MTDAAMLTLSRFRRAVSGRRGRLAWVSLLTEGTRYAGGYLQGARRGTDPHPLMPPTLYYQNNEGKRFKVRKVYFLHRVFRVYSLFC